MTTTSHGTTPAPHESQAWDSTSANALRADLSGDDRRLRAVTPDEAAPSILSARCRDLWAWERAVLAADNLGVKRRVSAHTVKAVALALRRHMNGPTKHDPGAGARPGTDRLAAELDLRRETVDRALAQLVKAGYLHLQVAGRKHRRAVYAAALPTDVALGLSVAHTPHKDALSVAHAPDKPGLSVAQTPHRPKEVKTTTTTTTTVGEPIQLPIVAAVTDNDDGGGGTPTGEQTPPVGDALQAVADALPDTLAAELLTDPQTAQINATLTRLAAQLPLPAIVDGCAGRLPNPLGSIAALLINHRLPVLERRAAGAGRGDAAKRKAREANARRMGDARALEGCTRDEALEQLAGAYPDDPDIQAAGLAAYDATAASIDQETG